MKDWATMRNMQHLVSDVSPSPSALHPLVSKKGEGLGLQGTEVSPGGLQQVTVDHSRGRENVNNTVGSIFIYSPGTVILGNSASERKEEAEDQPEGEDKNPEEGQAHVTNAPQQESSEENGDPMFWGQSPSGGS
ncbi:hypothetical protein SKAU_G00112870 [Synaphobranchus kaupii]|uniref:Uncharacterized protein n=1 Tax=Synaphobranchus kaupii TaxID=118154 RepID=A0A9Q1G0I4_SYNKA|nr:hypothetical protein SKAU_G00112870 [Synaphobranchus kaupii]